MSASPSASAAIPAKPRILIALSGYLPGYLAGGPVRSIANLVEWFGDEFDIRIVTSDRDFMAHAPYREVKVDAWTRIGKACVYYMSPRSQNFDGMVRLLRETSYDLLYLNSFFSPRFSLVPLIAMRFGLVSKRPVLLAPRGEFSRGAYRLKSWKKRPFTWMSSVLGLYRGVRWHASTELEALDIHRVLGVPQAQIDVACDLAAPIGGVATPAVRRRAHDGPLRVCFLSRISRMKNLDYALRVLAQIRTPVDFSIFGPKEDPVYWRECTELISAMPPHVKVSYHGPVPNEKVRETIAVFDVLFVPTRGENFGHVFLESWSVGVPVLISDQTPWRRLEAKGVGWDLPLDDPMQFARRIEEVSRWSQAKFDEVAAHTSELAASMAGASAILEANRRLFLDAIEQHAQHLR